MPQRDEWERHWTTFDASAEQIHWSTFDTSSDQIHASACVNPAELGSQPMRQPSADQSTEWWRKYPQHMFFLVHKDLSNLCSYSGASLVRLTKHSADFKVELFRNFKRNIHCNEYSPVLRCFDKTGFEWRKCCAFKWLEAKAHSFLTRFDFHEAARNGRIQEEDFINLTSWRAMSEYWRGVQGVDLLYDAWLVDRAGYCFLYKGHEGIVDAMERIQDNEAVIDRLRTAIEIVKAPQGEGHTYVWREGKGPIDLVYKGTHPNPSRQMIQFGMLRIAALLPTYHHTHSDSLPDGTQNSMASSSVSSHFASQPGEAQNSMAPSPTESHGRDCCLERRGTKSESQPLQSSGAQYILAWSPHQFNFRLPNLYLHGTLAGARAKAPPPTPKGPPPIPKVPPKAPPPLMNPPPPASFLPANQRIQVQEPPCCPKKIFDPGSGHRLGVETPQIGYRPPDHPSQAFTPSTPTSPPSSASSHSLPPPFRASGPPSPWFFLGTPLHVEDLLPSTAMRLNDIQGGSTAAHSNTTQVAMESAPSIDLNYHPLVPSSNFLRRRYIDNCIDLDLTQFHEVLSMLALLEEAYPGEHMLLINVTGLSARGIT